MRPAGSLARLQLSLLAVLAAASGCAGIPEPVESSERLRVTYADNRTEARLQIVSTADPEFADVANRPPEGVAVKRASPDVLREFVEYAADHEFFDYAREDESTDVRLPGTFRALSITADGRTWTFALEPGLGARDPDAVRRFTEIQLAFQQTYNSILSLQYAGDVGVEFFEREQQRLKRENRESVEQGGAGR